jgi:hypothetical protein
MARTALGSVTLLIGLLGVAMLLRSEAASTGPASASASKAIGQASMVVAQLTARQADGLLSANRSATGTYAGTDLSGLPGIRLVTADAQSYCALVSSSAGSSYVRPGGTVSSTPC